MTIVSLGVFMIMLLVMTAMATETVVAEDRWPEGPEDLPTGTPGEPEGTGIALVARGCSADPQSPVLYGGAYANYDTVFVHGINAVVDVPDTDIESVHRYGFGTDIFLYGKTSEWYPNAVIFCPIPGYDRKTGGVQPAVKYVAVQYMGGGPSYQPEIWAVDVYNGCNLVHSQTTSFANNGACSVQVIDMGNWYLFNRGLNIVLHVRNGASIPQGFQVSGYGARFEW